VFSRRGYGGANGFIAVQYLCVHNDAALRFFPAPDATNLTINNDDWFKDAIPGLQYLGRGEYVAAVFVGHRVFVVGGEQKSGSSAGCFKCGAGSKPIGLPVSYHMGQ
jgi:hypothetical protein